MADSDLLKAAEEDNYDLVKQLIKAGADINARDAHGKTALMYGACKSNHGIVSMLLEAGADVNAVGDDGTTALTLLDFMELDNMKLLIALMLIEAGADVNIPDHKGRTPLVRIMESWWMCQANSPLEVETIQLLLERGADPNSNLRGTPILYKVAEMGLADIARALIKAGADINMKNEDGRTPLIIATSYSHTGTVRVLIEAGVDVNMSDNEGKTALMWARAVCQGCSDIVKMLLEAGADVNVQDKAGKTALMWAAEFNWNDETVLSLIEAGANVDFMDNHGRSVLMYHKENIAMAILESGAEFNADTSLFQFLSMQYFRAADKLLTFNPIIKDIANPRVRLALPIFVDYLKRKKDL